MEQIVFVEGQNQQILPLQKVFNFRNQYVVPFLIDQVVQQMQCDFDQIRVCSLSKKKIFFQLIQIPRNKKKTKNKKLKE